MQTMSLALLVTLLTSRVDAAPIQGRVVALKPAIRGSVIVGRAVCGGSTWLLTGAAELIRISQGSDRPVTTRVKEFRVGDPFWGLACLDDGSLWTLATSHVLARLTRDGAIAERHTLLFPHVELFSAGDRLVSLSLPIVPNRPVLADSARRQPDNARPWGGLIGRPGFGTSPALATNLVGCGIAFAAAMPCWFGDEDRLSISDGMITRTVALPSLRRSGIDQRAPIRDVALVAGGAMWVLAASAAAPSGHRVGERLIKMNAAGVEQRALALSPAARLIVTADANTCVLLTTTGGLMYVGAEAIGR